MKRFSPYLAILGFLLPTVEAVRGEDVSLNFFYENLNGGNWYQVVDYGYVWQPDAATNQNWRPYTDGYWAYTDQGWTWVSYEDFGWATYHYGRWANLADYGWCWVPGYQWGPSWVSWRTGGDYIGWAPLPPARPREEAVYDSRPITPQVDVDFGIGPAYYNFVDLRYIGEPVLRDRIVPYTQNVTYIQNTVNVTNITFNNSLVYNYGPDFATVSRYSTRPIQRLTIQRETLNPMQAARSGNVTKVQGDRLLLAAPMKIQRTQGQQIAPANVKAKIAQPKFDKGWAEVKNPAEKQRLERQFKTENAKNVPKPDLQPNAGARTGAAAQTAALSPNGETTPAKAQGAPANARTNGQAATVGAGRNGKRNGKEQKGETKAGASAAPENSVLKASSNRPGKGKAPAAQTQPTAAASPATEDPEQASQPARGQKKMHREQQRQNSPQAAAPEAGTEGVRAEQNGARKNKAVQRERATPPQPPAPSAVPVPVAPVAAGNSPNSQRTNRVPAHNADAGNRPGKGRPAQQQKAAPAEEKGKKNKGKPEAAPTP